MDPGASGSKLLRDLFVYFMALLVAAPVIWLWPWPCLILGLLFFAAVVSPLCPWLLSRLAAVPEGAPPRTVAVLAGGFRGERLSPRTLRRLHHGIARARANGAALWLCGGARAGDLTEGQAMAQAAGALGYAGSLGIEDRSRTTLENLLALAQLAEHGAVCIVTCPQHAPRVRRLLRALRPAFRPDVTLVVGGYPPSDIPGGFWTRLALGGECFYEVAVHVWLTLRDGLVLCRVCAPLDRLRRAHLQ